MAQVTTELRELSDDELRRPARRDEAGAVQPALPARHRAARQHARVSATCAATSPGINTELRDARDRRGRGARCARRSLMADETNATEKPRTPRKVREGTVGVRRMDKTAVVAVIDRVRHPRYDKTVQRTKQLYVHDEANDLNVGDRVRVQETRPAVEAEALAGRRGPRAGEVRADDPAGDPPPGGRQQRRQRGARASRCSAARAAATPRSATSSWPP